MKKYISCCWIGFLCLLFISCHDFFKESSQDEIIPSTVEDLRVVLYSEAYPYTLGTYDTYLLLLTDEIQCNGLKNNNYVTIHENGTPVFTFNPEMFDGVEVFPDEANGWKAYYKQIMGCNVILDQVEEIGGNEQEKAALKAQALLLRSFYYMKLAMIYCQPYSGEGVNPEIALGLPLMLTMEITDDFPKRSSLKALYDQIEKDLLAAATMLKENEEYLPGNVYRVNPVAAYVLLSRFYLYKGDDASLNESIKYAGLAIEKGPLLTYLRNIPNGKSIYDTDASSEVVWTYGAASVFKHAIYFGSNRYSGAMPWTVSNKFMTLYDVENDLRYKTYFQISTGVVYGNKVGWNTLNGSDRGIRMAEAYLNRAEALTRRFVKSGNEADRVEALKCLNDLRETRFVEGTYVNEDITDGNKLLAFCLEERQRELCLEEGFRWYDIKRLGLSVRHSYIDAEGIAHEYVLESNSPLYALPIPKDAIDRNYQLEQNPR